MRTKGARFIAGTAVVLAVAGCASGPGDGKADPGDKYRAVLTQPSRLQPVPGQTGAYRWIAPDAKLGAYDKVLLDRIHVQLADPGEYGSVDPVALAHLVEYFRKSLEKSLGSAYPLVNRPGPDVLRVRATIVDVVPNDVAVSAATTAVAGPVATVLISEATGVPPGAAPYLGRTGIAVTFIDSRSGRVIGEFADTKFGQQYVLDPNKGVAGMVDANTKSFFDSFSKWAYVQQAFDYWAALFRKRLDEAHGK